ncbi:MAG: hypothetical protein AAF518_01135 [Spirochaetota bacterium]
MGLLKIKNFFVYLLFVTCILYCKQNDENLDETTSALLLQESLQPASLSESEHLQQLSPKQKQMIRNKLKQIRLSQRNLH